MYWAKFYQSTELNVANSQFSTFVLNYLKSWNYDLSTIVDLGCGNGRDTFYFFNYFISVTGIDNALSIEHPIFSKGDITKSWTLPNVKFPYAYSRFVIHALPFEELENHLYAVFNLLSENGFYFIETRSIKNTDIKENFIHTFTKGAIGEEHLRVLYDMDFLISVCKKNGFETIYKHESNGLALFKSEDPIVIRLILKKKMNDIV